MPRPSTGQPYEVILFMQGHSVSKQMRYSEFEAILDGVVSLREYADTEATLVYAELNRQLQIQALVFFLVYFDESGRAAPDWNLPLRQLAKNAGSGPDMGGGPIRLCCRSQCPISWHQKEMWDPGMKPGENDFQSIKRALEENPLGFEIEKESSAPVVTAVVAKPSSKTEEIPVLTSVDEVGLPSGLSHEHRVKIARIIRSQRLRIKTLIGQHKEELAEVSRQRRIEIQTLKNDLQGFRQRVEQSKVLLELLKSKLDQRNEQYLALQDQLAEAKRRLATLEDELHRADSSAKEDSRRVSHRLEAELVILKEQLERRDVELFYRDEREEQLRQEVEQLKEQLGRVGESGNILAQLAELDVVFVVYHPGAGHITIPPSDVHRYIANPTSYAAEKCFVTESHYQVWLEHYEHPVCTHKLPTGELCGDVLQRVTVPNEFVPGQDNRCEKHQR